MMASSMGSAEPGLPAKIMKACQTVWQSIINILNAITPCMTYTVTYHVPGTDVSGLTDAGIVDISCAEHLFGSYRQETNSVIN